ncbi:MAG TPA: signal peptidase II [Nitrospiria bacterium]
MAIKTVFKTIAEDTRRYLFLAAVSGGVILIDQITKAVIQNTMRLHESIPVIKNFFSLTYIRNPGAAFGLLADHDGAWRTIFFVVISLAAVVFLLTLYAGLSRSARFARLAVSLIMGGAVGNLVDRIRYGEVVDFLDFYIGSHHWPAFNAADSCITIGVGLLIWHFMREDRKTAPTEPAPSGHA